LLAKLLKHAEHPFYRSINHCFDSTVITKGMNSFETADCILDAYKSFTDCVIFGLDMSRFDQHVCEALLAWEHRAYTRMFRGQDRKELEQLLAWQRVNVGYVHLPEGFIKYHIRGCRMSGDINTAMGNVLLMCAMAYSYMSHLGFSTQDSASKRYRFVDNGDDCMIFVERRYANLVKDNLSWFETLGMVVKTEFVAEEPEQILFCQSRPVFDGHRWRMVRDYPTCLAKDINSLKRIDSEFMWHEWLTSIAECGAAMSGGIPIMQSFYNSLNVGRIPRKRRTDPRRRRAAPDLGIVHTGLWRLSRGMHTRQEPPTPAARVSFWKAFGVDCDRQKDIEKFYEQSRLTFQLLDRETTHLPARILY
jgi:hypothetical protein